MSNCKRKILITGGHGFIGRRLCKRLALEGHEVAIMDTEKESIVISGQSLLNYGDILARTNVELAFEQFEPDVVVHLAAMTGIRHVHSWHARRELWHVNVMGTLNLIEGCIGGAVPMVFASSCAVYGCNSVANGQDAEYFVETSHREPRSLYGLSKMSAEDLIYLNAKRHLRYCILRLGNVYGPFNRANPSSSAVNNVVNVFCEQIWKGHLEDRPAKIVFFGDGTQKRTFIYIDDVIDCLKFVIPFDDNTTNTTFNVGGHVRSVANVKNELCNLIGHDNVEIEEAEWYKGETLQSVLNSDKLSTALGRHFPHLEFVDGLTIVAHNFLNP